MREWLERRFGRPSEGNGHAPVERRDPAAEERRVAAQEMEGKRREISAKEEIRSGYIAIGEVGAAEKMEGRIKDLEEDVGALKRRLDALEPRDELLDLIGAPRRNGGR